MIFGSVMRINRKQTIQKNVQIPIFLLQKINARLKDFVVLAICFIFNKLGGKKGVNTAKLGFLIGNQVSLQQQFNSNMGDDGFDSVSIFLTEECKQCNRWSEEVPIQNLNYAGRWTEQQWSLYVKFSLKQICENKLKTSQVKPTPAHRRPYASFDRRFVEFVEAQKRHEKLTQEQKEILRKRAKSKFNTVKRNIKGKSKRHTQKNYLEQFQQMIYQEAQKLSRTPFNKGIFQLLECYETLPRQFGNPEFSEPREHTPSRRYLTRSEENRQNQNEISQQ